MCDLKAKRGVASQGRDVGLGDVQTNVRDAMCEEMLTAGGDDLSRESLVAMVGVNDNIAKRGDLLREGVDMHPTGSDDWVWRGGITQDGDDVKSERVGVKVGLWIVGVEELKELIVIIRRGNLWM